MIALSTQHLLARQQKLEQKLAELSVEAMIVTSQDNLRYLFNYTGEAGTGIVSAKGHFLITDYRFMEDAERECHGVELICRDRKKASLAMTVNQVIKDLNVQRVAFESASINHQQWCALSIALDTELRPTSGVIEQLRQIKDDYEIACIERAAAIADEALGELLPLIKPGVTEKILANRLEFMMREKGADDLAFPSIILFGPRASLPHGIPTEARLEPGQLILMDFGARFQGYRSDMTRTFVMGKANSEQQAVFERVYAAQQAAVALLSHGVNADRVNAASQKQLAQSSWAQYQGEGLGHGVGLALHERPFIGMDQYALLKSGMVITIEPGIYVPDWGGIRIEDDYLITDDGCRRINQAPVEFELSV